MRRRGLGLPFRASFRFLVKWAAFHRFSFFFFFLLIAWEEDSCSRLSFLTGWDGGTWGDPTVPTPRGSPEAGQPGGQCLALPRVPTGAFLAGESSPGIWAAGGPGNSCLI